MKCFFLMFPGIKRMEDKQNLGPLSDLIPFQSSDIKIPSESNALFHLVFERFPGHVWTQLFKSWGLGVTSAFFNFMYWNKVGNSNKHHIRYTYHKKKNMPIQYL